LGSLDRELFVTLNELHSPWLDDVMVGISNKWVWIPLYAFLLFRVVRIYGRQSIYILMSVGILILLSDQISVHFFKDVFQRLRPCHDERLADLVHIVNDHCGGQYGFISSHASNVFALAVFLGFMLKSEGRWWLYSLLVWAFIVSYTRIYLGVHYPLDIMVGGLVGAFLALTIFYLHRTVYRTWRLKIFQA
jgi:undecaprenyl-diphosphatase